MDNQQIQQQINELKARIDQLTDSSLIPRNIENALRKRLGITGSSSTTIISGVVTLAAGTATITDSRITTNSTIVATPEVSYVTGVFNGTIGAVCNSGNAVVFESGGASIDNVNYVIIL